MRTNRLRVLGPLVLATAVLLSSGCSQHAKDPASRAEEVRSTVMAPTTASVSPSPLARQRAAQPAVSAYLDMWHQVTIAAASSNYQASGLAAHATGPALVVLRGLLYDDYIAGQVTLGKPVPNPQVVDIRIPEVPIDVDIIDCVDSSSWRKYKSRGDQVENQPAGSQKVSATARNTDGTWKVFQLTIEKPGSC